MTKKLTETDYEEAAALIGVKKAAIKAVAAVEAAGDGFLSDGRPKILYERHIFYREHLKRETARIRAAVKAEMPGKADSLIDAEVAKRVVVLKNTLNTLVATKPTIVNTATGGYVGGVKEYADLAEAIKIDEEAAYRSASWGKFQIMGFHAELLGYPNAKAFAEDMQTGERAHLMAFVKFLKANPGMQKALQREDFTSFAKLYNGPAYAANKYDIKMLAAFKTFSVA